MSLIVRIESPKERQHLPKETVSSASELLVSSTAVNRAKRTRENARLVIPRHRPTAPLPEWNSLLPSQSSLSVSSWPSPRSVRLGTQSSCQQTGHGLHLASRQLTQRAIPSLVTFCGIHVLKWRMLNMLNMHHRSACLAPAPHEFPHCYSIPYA